MVCRYRKSLANPDAAHSDARDLALQLGCLARKVLPRLVGQKILSPSPSRSAHILRLETHFVKTVKTMERQGVITAWEGLVCREALKNNFSYWRSLVVRDWLKSWYLRLCSRVPWLNWSWPAVPDTPTPLFFSPMGDIFLGDRSSSSMRHAFPFNALWKAIVEDPSNRTDAAKAPRDRTSAEFPALLWERSFPVHQKLQVRKVGGVQ